MIGHKHRYTLVFEGLFPCLSNAHFLVPKEILESSFSKEHNDLWLDYRDLFLKVADACCCLVGQRFTIFGRAAFDNVRDVDRCSGDPHTIFDNLCEKLSCTSDERYSSNVFVFSRSLANEHDGCSYITGAENEFGACFTETTPLASFCFSLYHCHCLYRVSFFWWEWENGSRIAKGGNFMVPHEKGNHMIYSFLYNGVFFDHRIREAMESSYCFFLP